MVDLREVYRALDPATPASEPAHYVARPGDPIGILKEELSVRSTPLHVLIGGQRGVGKTTELTRLNAGLISAGMTVAMVGVDRRAMESSATRLFSALGAALAHSFLPVDSETRAELFQLSQRLSENADNPGTRQVVKTHFIDVIDEIKAKNHGINVIMLLDGLEKFPPQDVAALSHYISDLPCSFVMVAPLPFLLSSDYSEKIAEWDRIISLPAISLDRPGGVPYPEGAALLKSVVERRAGVGAFEEPAMGRLIESSGGIHRDLLTLAQSACMRAAVAGRLQVPEADALAAIEDRRQEMSFHLTPQDLAYLREIQTLQRLTGDPRAVPLISRNLIVSYHSDWAWFDIHPIIKPLVAAYQKMTGAA